MGNIIIREEVQTDYKETEHMTMRSFWNKYWPACSEHFLVRIIRESNDYIPEISRVAEMDGKIVGAVYYTKAWIVVIGEPNYYPRFGFERGAKYGITDAEGNSFDAIMFLPLTEEAREIKGKIIESADFEKLGDEAKLEEINKEFPAYRRVKVQEGFMQIFEQHLGVVESVKDDVYQVRYWELLIPAKVSESLIEKPVVGSDVQFVWNHKGESVITKTFRNLLEE